MDRIVVALVIAMAYELARGRVINLQPIFVSKESTSVSPPPATGISEKTIAFAAVEPPPRYKESIPEKVYLFNISSKPCVSCANRVSTLLFPGYSHGAVRATQDLKIPIMSQPFSDYKIIVVTAPWHMRISGRDSKPTVIYFVYHEDEEDLSNVNIPEIYFVKKRGGRKNKTEPIEPIIIVDNNRTVTGLKSKKVLKFIKLKRKLN